MWVSWKLSGNRSIFIVFTVCSGRKWSHGTWNPLVNFDTRPCSPVPTSKSCEHLCIWEYCLQITDFKFYCIFSTNCFSKHSKIMQIFMFFSTVLWVLLLSHMFSLFFFLSTGKRKGEEEFEALWCFQCVECVWLISSCAVYFGFGQSLGHWSWLRTTAIIKRRLMILCLEQSFWLLQFLFLLKEKINPVFCA